MPINTSEILDIVTTLSEVHNLFVAVNESFKGACVTGAGAMLGGLLLGPRGLAVGGIVGACSAAAMSNNKFRSVPDVIMNDLSSTQRDRLAASIRRVISDVGIREAVVLLPILWNEAAREAVIQSVKSFFEIQMGKQIFENTF